jgi:hypothetical protein
VASDGESSFFPFGIDIDVSDAIQLNSSWVFFGEPGWFQIAGTDIWALPGDLSSIGCGTENEPTCEPLGAWYFPGAHWAASVPDVLYILDSDGVTVSDLILVNNSGPNGSAQILFQSDPFPAVPEPTTLVLLGTGIGAASWRRRRTAARK